MDSGSRRRSSPSIASASKAAELHFVIMSAGKQRVEIGDAIDAQNNSLAIDDKPLLPIF
jgi:hypothetical protein